MNGVGMSPGYQMNPTYPYQMPQYTTPTYIPQQPQQTSNPSSISGRIIRSDEVVQPQEIPMNGSASVFPVQDGSAIYLKSWSPDGTIKTLKYVPDSSQAAGAQTPSATDQIMKRLEQLDAKISEISQQLK